jgi:hypothetical protein
VSGEGGWDGEGGGAIFQNLNTARAHPSLPAPPRPVGNRTRARAPSLSLSEMATASSSTASSSSSSPLTSILQTHATERTARRQRLDRAVEQVLLVADDVENNSRAALGLQLNSCVANQQLLEQGVKSLRQQVGALGKSCSAHGQAYSGLAAAVTEMGNMEAYLRHTDDALARIGADFVAVEKRLAQEE